MYKIPTPLKQELFRDFADRLQVYGLDRLTAMNAANENITPIVDRAYQAGIAAGEGSAEALTELDALIEKHSQRRWGDATYDTARTVMLDLRSDLGKALGIKAAS